MVKEDIMDPIFVQFSIVNIFLVPFVSVLIDSIINKSIPKFSYVNLIKYAIYTVFIFLLSKLTLYAMNIAVDNPYGTYSQPYGIIAIIYSFIAPLVINLIFSRFDIKIEVGKDEK